jgi:hypothetical protein
MPSRPSVIVVKKDAGSPVIRKLNPTNGSQSENRGARANVCSRSFFLFEAIHDNGAFEF